jgi:uncharacterized protein YqjF (DUF2071 family)
MSAPFLTAEWRSLVMLNYEIDPAVLQPFVPQGTELDQWQGKTFVSVVGFLFLNTRILGFTVPFHANFEEVNLRFYVRRRAADGWRRGVVFIRELVPRRAIAWTARAFYNENYLAVPMSHRSVIEDRGSRQRIAYAWIFQGRTHRLELCTKGDSGAAQAGSREEFITEHYWGYARQRNGGTVEYRVEHPRWRVWSARETVFDCEVEDLYGKVFASFLQQHPASAFLADGSAVTVYRGTRLSSTNGDPAPLPPI